MTQVRVASDASSAEHVCVCVCVCLCISVSLSVLLQTATSVVRTDQVVLATLSVTISTRLLCVFVAISSTIIDQRDHVAVCLFLSNK